MNSGSEVGNKAKTCPHEFAVQWREDRYMYAVTISCDVRYTERVLSPGGEACGLCTGQVREYLDSSLSS